MSHSKVCFNFIICVALIPFMVNAAMLKGRIVNSDNLTPVFGAVIQQKDGNKILGYSTFDGLFAVTIEPNASVSFMKKQPLQYKCPSGINHEKIYGINGISFTTDRLNSVTGKMSKGIYLKAGEDGFVKPWLYLGQNNVTKIRDNIVGPADLLGKRIHSDTEEYICVSKLGYMDVILDARIYNSDTLLNYGDVSIKTLQNTLNQEGNDSAKIGSVTIDETSYDVILVLSAEGKKEIIFKDGVWVDLLTYIDTERAEKKEICGVFYDELCKHIYDMNEAESICVVMQLLPDCAGETNCDKTNISESKNKLIGLSGLEAAVIEELEKGEIKMTLTKEQIISLKDMAWLIGAVEYSVYIAGPSIQYH